MLHCENKFCIYEHEQTCILPDDLSFTNRGLCDYYCPIDLDDTFLREQKRRLLAEYETPEFIKKYDALLSDYNFKKE